MWTFGFTSSIINSLGHKLVFCFPHLAAGDEGILFFLMAKQKNFCRQLLETDCFTSSGSQQLVLAWTSLECVHCYLIWSLYLAISVGNFCVGICVLTLECKIPQGLSATACTVTNCPRTPFYVILPKISLVHIGNSCRCFLLFSFSFFWGQRDIL